MVTPGYTAVAVDPYVELDRVAYYDQCVLRQDGRCVSTLSKDFMDEHSFSGIYGISEPFTHTVVYVGRSISISKRFQNHLRAHQTDTDGPCVRRKNAFVKAVLAGGRKPGLVLFDFDNSPACEARYIRKIIPIYNLKCTQISFNDTDANLVRKLARWHHSFGQDSKIHGYEAPPYESLWDGFRRHVHPY